MTYTHIRDLLGLFRNGYDSLEISYISGLPEPTVYNQLHEQREAERLKAPKPRRVTVLFSEFDDNMLEELKNTKWNETKPYYPKLIPYAGKDD